MLRLKDIFIILIIASISSFGLAQNTPFFKNFNLSKYNATNQNWDVSVADNGKVYVANGKGLMEYDGLNWKFHELPNKTTMRSVLAYNDRIYTGSFEEIGYWQKDAKGQLYYTSLNGLINEGISTDEEFWQIVPYKTGIAFRSFSTLYVYENDKIVKIKPESTIISISIVRDELLVSTLKNGVYHYEHAELQPFINAEGIKNKKIVDIIEKPQGYLIATALNGLYNYINGELLPIDSEISVLIKQHQLNVFTQLDNGNMAFGTIKNGIYYTNSRGDVLFHLSKEEGLFNNTVLNQFVFKENLWLSLDNGVALIDLNGDYTFFNDVSGKLGAVYDVIYFDGTYFIGSNTGLFYLDSKGQLQFVENSQGQVWDLREINGQLICGHNDGTYLVENKTIKKISPYTGGWTLKRVPETSDVYVQGTYAGLVKFENPKQDEWKIKHLGKTTMPLRYLVFEDAYTAWAAHAYKGLYKIKFDHNYDTIKTVSSYEKKGLWSSYNVRVYKLKNDICFKTNNGWQKYEPLLDSIVPFDLLNKNLGADSYIISDFNSDVLVTKSKNEAVNFISFDSNTNNLSLTNKYFENRLVVGSEKVSQINDSIYALNLNDGFMLINTQNYHTQHRLYPPEIEFVSINNELMDLSEFDKDQKFDVKYGKTISLGLSSSQSDNYYLEYAFTNSDSLKWNTLLNDKLELNNLNDGLNTIFLRTRNDYGDASKNIEFNINVLPPWYRDTLGYVIYFLIVALVLIIMYILHTRKINKEQKLLQDKFENEQRELLKEKTLENEKKIVQLRNESLRNEIKLKSKQLANSAMALVKKNETLQDLKQELLQHKGEFNNYYSYKKLIKKIDTSIEHEDEWEVFEHNFNQVHEEFFNKLKTEHPALTHKDLKICAYIKMNLSTKEIAPLMNISIRGVETHRYRLKRKLNLDNDNSLSDYLLNFN